MIRRILSAAIALALFTAASLDAQSKARDEFVVGMGSYGVELHPYKTVYSHDMQALNALYEGLFSYDPETMDPVRAHAESYAKSADGKTWTFTLRADRFEIAGLKIDMPAATDPEERFFGRILSIEALNALLDDLYILFVSEVQEKTWKTKGYREFQKWLAAREV